MKTDFARNLEDSLEHHKDEILHTIRNAFSNEIHNYDWFSEEYITDVVTNFKHQFDITFTYFKSLLGEYEQERLKLFESLRGRIDTNQDRRSSTVNRQISKMWNGKD